MGYFYSGLPPYMLKWAGAVLPVGTPAVETGTFQGDSAKQIADVLGGCITIEKDQKLASLAAERFLSDPRVNVLQGSSAEHIGALLERDRRPRLWWLDAHWSGGVTAGADDPCPVMAELSLILKLDDPGVVLIDDARIFGCSSPNDPTNAAWPSLHEVLHALEAGGLRSLLLDDVIVGVPPNRVDDFRALTGTSRQLGSVGPLFARWESLQRSVVRADVRRERGRRGKQVLKGWLGR